MRRVAGRWLLDWLQALKVVIGWGREGPGVWVRHWKRWDVQVGLVGSS